MSECHWIEKEPSLYSDVSHDVSASSSIANYKQTSPHKMTETTKSHLTWRGEEFMARTEPVFFGTSMIKWRHKGRSVFRLFIYWCHVLSGTRSSPPLQGQQRFLQEYKYIKRNIKKYKRSVWLHFFLWRLLPHNSHFCFLAYCQNSITQGWFMTTGLQAKLLSKQLDEWSKSGLPKPDLNHTL